MSMQSMSVPTPISYSNLQVVCSLPHEEVVGLHFTGPNAGEVLQGFAVAMRCVCVCVHVYCCVFLIGILS